MRQWLLQAMYAQPHPQHTQSETHMSVDKPLQTQTFDCSGDCVTQLTFSQATLTEEADTDCFTMTGNRGNIKYIKLLPDNEDDDDPPMRPRPGTLLCGKTIEQLNAERLERVKRAQAEPEPPRAAPSSQLLVDRYRPEKFTDLTGSEELNLKVVEWFKEWNPVVFNKPKNTSIKLADKQDRNEDTRPDPRILLLSGPPGAGKTTLATVAARHCGYRCVHINASMDRTASSLDERINVAATGVNTLDDRPSCLILDEVDGIAHSNGAGVLSNLIKLATTEWKLRGKKPLQLRPVVCICNNPWVRELRGLREVAEFIKIDALSSFKLSERLDQICNYEGINAEKSALRELCNLSNGDIRSCLFSLQFLSQKYHSKRITHQQVSGVGMKDRVPSFVDVMDAIFYGDDAKAAVTLKALGHEDTRYTGKLSVVLLRHLTRGHPEMDRIFEACYTEYLTAKYHDYDLTKTSKISKLVSNFDTLQKSAREKVLHGVQYMYAPQILVDIHTTVQATKLARKKWVYPKEFFENKRKIERTTELLDAQLGSKKLFLTKTSMALDYLAPLLAALATQSIKPKKSFHVESEEDKKKFQALVSLYAEHRITYTTQQVYCKKTAGMVERLVMKPDLNSLSFYNKECRRYPILYDSVKIRLICALKLNAIQNDIQKTVPVKAVPEPTERKRKIETHLSGLKKRREMVPKAPSKRSVKRDMFGNVVKCRTPSPRNSGSKRQPALAFHPMFNPDLGCKYEQNRGFTNAVRRRSTWAEWA
eukprot:TRINITY_DN6155_c0_g1_i3.p1 TRINITY_DN6155_c0_g1~~TRINITY_DN6155_c0_g1_i3.p1  ORF type:complete len:762 (+),score=212.70 TRINITY_DN6155_c0_g1_i3:125-2410(+)